MPIVELSRAARDVLRRRAPGEGVDVTPGNLEAYSELVRAGVMYPLSGFLKGPQSALRIRPTGRPATPSRSPKPASASPSASP
jgi:hypothetical protein